MVSKHFLPGSRRDGKVCFIVSVDTCSGSYLKPVIPYNVNALPEAGMPMPSRQSESKLSLGGAASVRMSDQTCHLASQGQGTLEHRSATIAYSTV